MKDSVLYRMIGGGFASVITYLLGGMDQVLSILLLLIVVDYVTGFFGSAVKGELSSKVGFNGILKKVLILVVVVIAVQLDKLAGQTNVIRYMVCFFYIANEGISILENISKAGVPLPNFMLNLLKVMKEQSDNGNV